jgi:hypothetical protein
MTAARRRVSVIVLAGVSALLGGGVGPAFPAEPPADVVADLEREVGPRSGAACPDAGIYSLARPDSAAGPTVVGLGIFFQDVASLSDVDQTLDTDVYVVAASALAQRPDSRVIDRVNQWGRWVFPLAMLANFALAFLS